MPDARLDRCWYCRAADADLLCDYRLGAVLVDPEGAPAQLELGQEPPPQVEVVETCDVGACRPCARRFGWRTISSLILCVRRGRGRGCHRDSLDHCHLHAAAENRGSDAWIGGAAVELHRREARSACIVLFAAGGT